MSVSSSQLQTIPIPEEQAIPFFDALATVELATRIDRLVRDASPLSPSRGNASYDALRGGILSIKGNDDLSLCAQYSLLAFIFSSITSKNIALANPTTPYAIERAVVLQQFKRVSVEQKRLSSFPSISIQRGENPEVQRFLVHRQAFPQFPTWEQMTMQEPLNHLFGYYLFSTGRRVQELSPELIDHLTEAARIKLYVDSFTGKETRPNIQNLEQPAILRTSSEEISADPMLRAQAVLFIASFLAAFEENSDTVIQTVRDLIHGDPVDDETIAGLKQRLETMVASYFPTFWQQHESLLQFFPLEPRPAGSGSCAIQKPAKRARAGKPTTFESIERAVHPRPPNRRRAAQRPAPLEPLSVSASAAAANPSPAAGTAPSISEPTYTFDPETDLLRATPSTEREDTVSPPELPPAEDPDNYLS